MDKEEFRFEIVRPVGVIGEEGRGWRTEVNLVSWNGREPKIDVRPWSPDHQKMGKGIGLSREEALRLVEVLKAYLAE
ncbi:MAG: hypothetical protein GX430_01195 [Treponema sp.]|nr:hypothetical protein [Treponema sp.]